MPYQRYKREQTCPKCGGHFFTVSKYKKHLSYCDAIQPPDFITTISPTVTACANAAPLECTPSASPIPSVSQCTAPTTSTVATESDAQPLVGQMVTSLRQSLLDHYLELRYNKCVPETVLQMMFDNNEAVLRSVLSVVAPTYSHVVPSSLYSALSTKHRREKILESNTLGLNVQIHKPWYFIPPSPQIQYCLNDDQWLQSHSKTRLLHIRNDNTYRSMYDGSVVREMVQNVKEDFVVPVSVFFKVFKSLYLQFYRSNCFTMKFQLSMQLVPFRATRSWPLSVGPM